VLSQLEVKEGQKIADFGCGHGYFTLLLARLVGKTGKVLAIDILAEALDAVRSRAQLESLTNIECFRGNLEANEGSKLQSNEIDGVLLHNILFQSQKKSDILKEAARILKANGFLALIDWLPIVSEEEKTPFSPGGGWRISVQEAQQMAEQVGFSLIKKFDAGQYHYGLLFIKK
jgi:ubiquinone/menaquinone biosynthesis C-methylase UbiE